MGKITIPVSVLPLFRQSQRDEIHRKIDTGLISMIL